MVTKEIKGFKMQEVDFRTEVKKYILGEEKGNLLIDFTSLNKALAGNGFGNIQKSLDAHIVESDKQELAKELKCSVNDCIFLDNGVSDLRRYSVGTNLYTIDRVKNIEKIATFDKSKAR